MGIPIWILSAPNVLNLKNVYVGQLLSFTLTYSICLVIPTIKMQMEGFGLQIKKALEKVLLNLFQANNQEEITLQV